MKNSIVFPYGAIAAPLIFALNGSGGASWGAVPLPIAAESTDCENLDDDVALATAIRMRLLASASIEATDIEILVQDGTVGLRGQARSHAQKSSAGELAGDTLGVHDVINQLDVIDWVPITDVGRAQAQSRAAERERAAIQSDAWISATIVQTLRTSRDVGSCGILVATREGVVTLQGDVGSGAARDRAVALAGDTWGVRRVIAVQLAVR